MNVLHRLFRYFRLWEILLVLFSGTSVMIAATVYVRGISLRKYILGWQIEEKSEPFGKVAVKQGTLRRQFMNDTDFLSIEKGTQVLNNDTLVTSSTGSATIALEDGGQIELAPNTMVRLALQSKLTVGGVAQSANISVIAGNVTGSSGRSDIVLHSGDKEIRIEKNSRQAVRAESEEPAATAAEEAPAPVTIKTKIEVSALAPKNGQRIQPEDVHGAIRKRVVLEWKTVPAHSEVAVTLRRIDRRPAQAVVEDKSVITPGDQGSLEVLVDHPGTYEWELTTPHGERLPSSTPKSKFVVEREVKLIESLPPLITQTRSGDEEDSDSPHPKTAMNVTLRWKPIAGAHSYTVSILKSPRGPTLLTRNVSEEQFHLDPRWIQNGKTHYIISAALPSGFLATSGPQVFSVALAPPILTVPRNHATVTQASLAQNDDSILLMWEKTGYSDQYEIQIARDAQFKSVLETHRFKENFFVFQSPKLGNYWWRVRGVSNQISGPYSPASALNITQ